jgi:lactoylglutathione lyase
MILAVLLVSRPLSAQTVSATAEVSFNHLAIYVMDLKKSSSFYENIIGLDTIPEPFHDGKHAWYDLGPRMSLHVIEGATKKEIYPRNHHLCFSVASVDQFIEKLKANNIAFENVKGEKMKYTIRPDGIKQIWFNDPDGYWIEINDAKE